MTRHIVLWKQLMISGITALVGAGGKTTVLSKLVSYGQLIGKETMVSSTTKMYESQVVTWDPYYGDNLAEAETYCTSAMARKGYAAWFHSVANTKVIGLRGEYIDSIHRKHPQWHIVVEADGAKEKWLTAHKRTEPVIPTMTRRTIGMVNLQILNQTLTPSYIHNLPLLLQLLDVPVGTAMTPDLLARFVGHEHGLFQYAKGEYILFCTGADTVDKEKIHNFIALLPTTISMIVLAKGYEEDCQIDKVIQWH